MVAPRFFPRPSVLSSSDCIYLKLKTHIPAPVSHRAPSFNESPAYKQRTAPLRAFAHLAAIGWTLCVDAAAFASTYAHQLHMLFFAVFNAHLPACSHLALMCGSHAILRLVETHASAVASAFAI
eukprot:1076695-Pleurochrysis_carterae.AAC.1